MRPAGPSAADSPATAVVPTGNGESSRARIDGQVTRGAMAQSSDGLAGSAVPRAAAEGQAAGSTLKAVARLKGTASPGLRITLSGGDSRGNNLRFLWVQTRGPEVVLDRPEASEVSFIVPAEATAMTFHLVVAGRGGFDRAVLEIPVEQRSRPEMRAMVVADAGDDQVAVVGHRVTLNGIRSQPRSRLAYRWIQIEGRGVSDRTEEGCFYSFVPAEPGLHRFLLVVSSDGFISQPDEVRVSVLPQGEAPPGLRSASRERGVHQKGDPDEAAAEPALRQARQLLSTMAGGARTGRELAVAFEGIAGRISVYTTYGEVLSEISRRIDAVLPHGSVERAEWDRVVFEPLSQRIIRSLRPVGLDLSMDQSEDKSLTDEQKDTLAVLFRGIARGFRAGLSD